MKLKEMLAAILGLQSRLDKIEGVTVPQPKAEGDAAEGDDSADGNADGEAQAAEGEEAKDKEAEGDGTPGDGEDEGDDAEQSAQIATSLQALTDKVAAIETNLQQALDQHKAKLEAEFDAKVKAEAAKLDADRQAQRAEAPLKTGKPTTADKQATAALKGRARVAAAIASERSK